MKDLIESVVVLIPEATHVMHTKLEGGCELFTPIQVESDKVAKNLKDYVQGMADIQGEWPPTSP